MEVRSMKTIVDVSHMRKLGEISPDIYGQYFEHVEDCIYPSIWDDQSEHSDEKGLRSDVVQAAAELAVPVVRWPGGCFADVYHWEDGIGPPESRPLKWNWHWEQLESNRFGTDEFMRWCELVGAKPYINFNLGTGTMEEALRWMDYCNGTQLTPEVKKRHENGRIEPYNVKLWGIGNETWAHWEAGQMKAEEYAFKLSNWCEFVRKVQPESQILAVGSDDANDEHWDRTVLLQAGKHIDYLTLHVYGVSYERDTGQEFGHMAFASVYFEQRMRKVMRIIEETAAARGGRNIRIALDEWNVRHCFWDEEVKYHKFRRNSPRNLQDAIFAAGVLNSMIRLSPHVAMANYVFFVNGNAVMNVHKDGLVKTPLYDVFYQYGKKMQGQSIEAKIYGPSTITPKPQINWPKYELPDGFQPETATYIDAVAAMNGEELNISLINRHQFSDIETELLLPPGYVIKEAWTLNHEDIYAANDVYYPEKVKGYSKTVEGTTTSWLVPAHAIVLLSCQQQ